MKDKLAAYARFVQQMVTKSRDALVNGRRELLDDIIGRDEARANASEMDLDEEGTSIIAQHQPMARDLRTVLMVLRITNDLERMADHAVNIAEALKEHAAVRGPLADPEVARMFDVTLGMVDSAIRAFLDEDAALGQAVCRQDATVDALATSALERLSSSMTDDPATVERNLVLLKVAGNLERVADLSTNIGEDVIYMVEGRVIKHHHAEGPR